MKKFKIAYLFLIISIVLSSCSSMYIQSTTNIPLLEKKGEKQVELTASTNSLHLTGNYAFSDNYSVMINGGVSYKNFSTYYDIFTDSEPYEGSTGGVMSMDLTFDDGEFAHKYGEIGIGRYNILHKKLKLEAFGGIGYGIATDQDVGASGVNELNYEADYYLGFLQMNIGSSIKKLEFGGAVRLATTFFDYTYQDYYTGLAQNVGFNMFHIEPMVFLRIGGEHLKFVYRWAFSYSEPYKSLNGLNVEKGIYNGNVLTSGMLISVGINYTFGIKE